MENIRLEHEVYKSFPKIVEEYLKNESNAPEYFPQPFTYEELIRSAGKRSFSDQNRKLLVDRLLNQYKDDGIVLNQDHLARIQKLSDPRSFTVVTGHQLCLFTGPLYFIIKILQTIRLASELNEKQKDFNFIPVFWMATEDHDFEEINHCHLFGRTLKWDKDEEGMVGEMKTESISEVIKELSEILGDSKQAEEIREILEKAYNSRNLAAATRKLVHELFGERGIVIVDGNDAELKSVFSGIVKKELTGQIIQQECDKTTSKFKKEFKVQVNPREINLFYVQKGARNRIERNGSQFNLVGKDKAWTESELLQEVDSNPERFSPNVLLRPVYQETILPNLCYIGGPAEISYWIQLKSAFEAFGIDFPILNLRNSIMWLDKSKLKKLDKLGLEISDLFSTESIISKKLVEFEELEQQLDSELSKIGQGMQSISDIIVDMDASLKPVVLGEGKKIQNQLAQLKGRLIKARKAKNEERLNSFWNLHEKVFPGGNLHERYDNFVPYFLKHSHNFFEVLYNSLDPMDSRLIVVLDN